MIDLAEQTENGAKCAKKYPRTMQALVNVYRIAHQRIPLLKSSLSIKERECVSICILSADEYRYIFLNPLISAVWANISLTACLTT